MTNNFRLVFFAAGFVIAVAGCGGGGDNGDDGGDDDNAPDAASTNDPDAAVSPTPVALANVPSLATCPGVDLFSITPILPDEAGHFAAARLTPETYPVDVTTVAYDLAVPGAGGDCDLTLAHTVEVYVDTAIAPAARPSDGTLVHRIDVPGGAAANHAVELTLPTPIHLTTGQSVFVAVKLVGDDTANPTSALCIAACRTAAGAISDVDYWSNAAAEPFAWADMVDDFGFTYNFTIRAAGTHP